MISELGRALSCLAIAEARESIMHDDVSAWGAPSECHKSVSRGEEARMLEATAEAEAIAGAPWDDVWAEAERRIGKHALARAMQRAAMNYEFRNSPFLGS